MTDTPITHPLSPTEREKCDELLDHIYEYTTLSEGVCRRIDAFVAAVRKAEADRQAAELVRLRAEVEALRVDAERWRWVATPGNASIYLHRTDDETVLHVDKDRLRAAIDAARTPEGRSDG